MITGRHLMAFVSAVLLSGCVSTTTATIKPEGSEELVQLQRTTAGLVVGPCGPLPGKMRQPYWLRLKGPGPTFDSSDVEFLDEKGLAWSVRPENLQGQVRIEAGRHQVVVALSSNGVAMHMNGTYRIAGQR